MWKTFVVFFLFSANLCAASGSIDLHVQESAGIRRTGYPVAGRVPFVKGELKDPSHVRVMLADREISAQVAVESRWPDNSIQILDVDFNAAIAPLGSQTYQVEYGDDVKAAAPARGLTANATADGFQIGNVHLGKKPSPLVQSVGYRQEDIGKGTNAFTVVDDKGKVHELTSDAIKSELVKPGPVDVLIRYTGKAVIDTDYSVDFVITAEMPSGKTWIKYSATVDDPAKRLRSIAFNSPILFGAFPWLWDFGTGSWSYGSFRNADDTVTLTQVVKPGADNWTIENGPKDKVQLYEAAGGNRPRIAEGWGHFQDGKEVIAFGFDKFGQLPGTYTISFDAHGQELFQYAPLQPRTKLQITLYQHYVASPTPIGAVTSPVSMLNPLTAVCAAEQYKKAGVAAPPNAFVPKKP